MLELFLIDGADGPRTTIKEKKNGIGSVSGK